MRIAQSNLRSTRRPGRHGPTAAASAGGGAAPSPPPDPASLPATTRLRLSVPYHTAYGHHLAVVGDHPALGEWAPERAVPMAWGDGGERGDTWSVELATPAVASSPASAAARGAPAPSSPAWSYKYIVREGDRALDWSQVRAWKEGAGSPLFMSSLSLPRHSSSPINPSPLSLPT